ncbi:MAG TPA: cobamide remodeling phosphodiesterase CbiR [Spirochaetia bacterium]|nr:cobamide remodeling phosphodiesterase CbiR [Spirochaetales bacterium]HRY80305.1 cobamide remodeling phosphodiesterase CbiR [Spirochaetia bacterium]HRZ87945.1 cobamide remodeling phosphodiesterase CbiR [Spirochaetia bacterium]
MILSVPSYVIPGTYAENLRFLADKPEVEGVELLFYLWDAEVAGLLDRELAEIRSFMDRFRFTAHLPDRILPEHRVLLDRIADTARSFVVHPPSDLDGLAPFADLLSVWKSGFGDRFFLENLRSEPFGRALRVLPDIPLCVDAGHILAEGGDPAELLARLRSTGRRIEELHLHGLSGDADHQPFGEGASWLRDLAPFLAGFDGVAEIELFDWEEARTALAAVRRAGVEAAASEAAAGPRSGRTARAAAPGKETE